jgi:peroxiredoxin
MKGSCEPAVDSLFTYAWGSRSDAALQIMKCLASVAVVVLYGAFLGCTESVTETTSRHLPKPGAPSFEIVNAGTSSPPQSEVPDPQRHEVRKEVVTEPGDPVATDAPGIPKVFLTAEHSAMCRVRTGDPLPAVGLAQLSGGETELARLRGKQATVVLFWGEDAWMSETALADLAAIELSSDIAVVGIAVQLPKNEAEAVIEKAGVKFHILLDADGKAFNQVGMTKMPRVYVLNESGEIVWFDIEYSQSTQRELEQTLAVLTGE